MDWQADSLGCMKTAVEMLALYLAAESAVLGGKSVRVGEKMMTSEDRPEIRKGRQEWESRLAAAQRAARGESSVRFSRARLS